MQLRSRYSSAIYLTFFSDKPANESLHAEPGQGGERALPAGGALPGNRQQVEGGADARDRGVHQSAAAESHHRPDALLHSAEEEPLLHVLSSRAVGAAVSSRRRRRRHRFSSLLAYCSATLNVTYSCIVALRSRLCNILNIARFSVATPIAMCSMRNRPRKKWLLPHRLLS